MYVNDEGDATLNKIGKYNSETGGADVSPYLYALCMVFAMMASCAVRRVPYAGDGSVLLMPLRAVSILYSS